MLGHFVSPTRCALLLAIPLDYREFAADSVNPNKDLAKNVRSYNRYERVVLQPLRPILDEVEAAGVTVLRHSKTDHITDACRRFPVITLLAHWKYLLMEEQDVLDVERFHRQLSFASDNPGRAESAQAELFGDLRVRNASTKAELAAVLAEVLKPAYLYHMWEEEVDLRPEGGRPTGGMTRVLLEEQFPGCFSMGRSLELADRLHGALECIDAIPENYEGLIDLIICHGEILGEAAKRQRPRCNFIFPAQPATIDVRLTFYKHTIRQLHNTPGPYEVAMARAHTELIAVLRKKRRSIKNETE